MSPFYATYGYHARMDLSITNSSDLSAAQSTNAKAEKRIQALHDVQEELTATLHKAIQQYSKHYNEHVKAAPNFEIGSKVWLLRRGGLTTPRPSRKLDYKRLGPFTVIQRISPVAFRLELPATAKIHNVFHVSLLEPCVESSIPGRHQVPPPPVVLEGDEHFLVDRILAQRTRHRKVQYLVRWQGYGPEHDTWEPLSNLANAQDPLRDFEAARASRELSLRRVPTVRNGGTRSGRIQRKRT